MLKRLTFTPVLDTAAYGAGDTLFITTAVGQLTHIGQPALLRAVAIHDKDDEGAAIKLYFLRENVTFGALNDAPSLSDANSVFVTGKLAVASADYLDLGGSKHAFYSDLAIPLGGAEGTGVLYMAATADATPTYTAVGDIVIDLWYQQIP